MNSQIRIFIIMSLSIYPIKKNTLFINALEERKIRNTTIADKNNN